MIPLEWSEPLDLSGPGPFFSPSGEHIAYVLEKDKIIVRDVHTLSIVAYFSCLSPPNQLQWSPNGRYLLCTMYARRLVTVYSVIKDENDDNDNSGDLDPSSGWVCNLSERLAGVSHSMWSGNGRHVVVVSDFQVKTSAWSLLDSSCTSLHPAKCGGAGVKGSPDGSLLAVLTVGLYLLFWLGVLGVNVCIFNGSTELKKIRLLNGLNVLSEKERWLCRGKIMWIPCVCMMPRYGNLCIK